MPQVLTAFWKASVGGSQMFACVGISRGHRVNHRILSPSPRRTKPVGLSDGLGMGVAVHPGDCGTGGVQITH